MGKTIADAQARLTALDPSKSFIVQAPAGSGKTALLIQRILKLLTLAQQPEEVLAITFTRKAADEMRDRLLEALLLAQQPEPNQDYAKLTWQLARELQQRDIDKNWQLTNNPSRLRIQTIDSFCASVVRQMPMTSGFGAVTATMDDARPLYRQAARNTLKSLSEKESGEHVACLLQHLDNNLGKIETLLVGMLQRRDQWLGVITGGDPQGALEQGLHQVVSDHLETLSANIPRSFRHDVCELAIFSANNLVENPKDKGLMSAWLTRSSIPTSHVESLNAWQGLAELCLTKTGGLRKQLNKNIGFPAGADEEKQRFKDLLNTLNDQSQFVALLNQVRLLPTLHFTDNQWQLLNSLRVLLLRAVAELQLLFQKQGEVDYAEVQLRALMALGEVDSPTDLALTLDYRIQHILVDEFQDTATGQFRLLEKLCAGWEVDDGRSFFVVGDPMQSIYRFRNAEIGLYLQARSSGIGGMVLQPLTLSVNFRSQKGIVDWVNLAFKQIFPEYTEVATGAVQYSPSIAYHDATTAALQVCPYLGRNDTGEAEQMISIIQEALASHKDHTVAVLVRSRSQLHAVSQALKVHNIAYQALDVLPLSALQVVKDLRVLTRAMLHPGDRLAWLSVLRAPWCGLDIADLLKIAKNRRQEIFTQLSSDHLIETLSEHGKKSATRLQQVLSDALKHQQRLPLRQWIEGAWLSIGGAACLHDTLEQEAVRSYFDLLETHDHGSNIIDFAAFDTALEDLYAPPDPAADSRLQLMTIHKAKGLQFGTVIMPGLGRPTRSEDKRLLEWLIRPNSHGDIDLLIAPIHAPNHKDDAIYNYLRETEKQKVIQERNRLLYVATTRAEQKLVLMGHVNWNEKDACISKPASGSLLECLWPIIANEFTKLQPDMMNVTERETSNIAYLHRLPDGWMPPSLPLQPSFATTPVIAVSSETTSIEFDWAGQTARHVGTLVHRYLEQIANQGLAHWNIETIKQHQASIKMGLVNLGVAADKLSNAAIKVTQALTQTLEDDRGLWILDNHTDAATEQALTASYNQETRSYIIDRTFIDESGTRWIIDYKTGMHEGGNLDTFIDQEQERYRTQLESYGQLYAQLEDRPIRLALYFPMNGGWKEWQATL